MFLKKNEEKTKQEEKMIIEVSQKKGEMNFFLKIYFSKDKQSIIFKIEEENIQSYYYYEKYCLIDLQNNYKSFTQMNSLTQIFQNIEFIINKYTTKIENESNNKIKISFINVSNIVETFILRKKIVSQNRLNQIIMKQIKENKNKIKLLKKNNAKFEKTINEQNDIIKNINSKIEKINENFENIIKEIEDTKNKINNLNPEEQNNSNKKKNKSKNNKIQGKNNKNDNDKDSESNHCFSCKKQTLYESLFFFNIFIIILIAYIFIKLKVIEEKLELERIRKNKMNSKYQFIEMLETMSDKDLEYIQNTFDTGEMVIQDKKYLMQYEEEENEAEDSNKKKKKKKADNNDKSNKKNMKENRKSKKEK